MNKHFRTSALPMLLAGLLGAGWAGTSYACSSEPYLGGVCIMAWSKTANFGGGTYALANGASLPVSGYSALYSVIGTTFGGNGTTNFQLPDLQGRVVVGAGSGAGLPTYTAGMKGGSVTATLTNAQLPYHAHGLMTGAGGVTVNVSPGTLAANTTLSGLTATTTLAGVTANASASGLTLNAYNGNGTASTGSGNALATASSPTSKIYSGTAPNVAMIAGSISGTAPVTFTGNPATTISGNPTTTLSGTQSVQISGMTSPAGQGLPFSVMPPYLALAYYIAISGMYPSQN